MVKIFMKLKSVCSFSSVFSAVMLLGEEVCVGGSEMHTRRLSGRCAHRKQQITKTNSNKAQLCLLLWSVCFKF